MTLLSDAEIADRLPDGWRHEDGALVHDHEAEDFAGAMAYANAVAEHAEAANHHPDILVHAWNKVRLTLSTHSEGGVTAADVALTGKLAGL
jgi:4a-hydroxytetrahydrobiopterin dehydratase